MTARQFVAALRRSARQDRLKRDFTRPWLSVPERLTRAPRSPDPILDLLARYDLSAVAIGQFRFETVRVVEFDGLRLVAERNVTEFYVGGGRVHGMHCHAAYPDDTGLTSAVFLALVALYAEYMASTPHDASGETYAARAAALSPHAARLYWFGEPLPGRAARPSAGGEGVAVRRA